jgi:hypothetical protein
VKRPHLISVDELRAAGALDVPAAWRKSLGGQVERDLFSDLPDSDLLDEPAEASAAEVRASSEADEPEQGDG